MTAAQTGTWGGTDNNAAEAEGWCVATSHKGVLLERLDEAGAFPDDRAAIEHVRLRAAQGSTLHQKAIAITDNAQGY